MLARRLIVELIVGAFIYSVSIFGPMRSFGCGKKNRWKPPEWITLESIEDAGSEPFG